MFLVIKYLRNCNCTESKSIYLRYHFEIQIKQVLDGLYENRKIAQATHNIYAYRISLGDNMCQGCEDDGETHAGSRLLHLLQVCSVLPSYIEAQWL